MCLCPQRELELKPVSDLVLPDHRRIPLDRDGYLRNLDDWNPEVAEHLAQTVSVSMTPAHWEVVEVLRDFYRESGLSPAMRPLVKLVTRELGTDKGRSIYLMKLFPGNPALLASKIAGLPRPTNCF
ncbi:MAG: TusE/DsrC/DsvC family sulfur relay protein [Pseudomonadales bacterium]|nr:TusE/DsrC/DsvC family sulfur relay protein [Pseudomonadales bacterium]MCP5357301.1 TusE/DsrC/DsvC family sulfur relay protein [Pseudomonadales bacterium]